MTTEVLDPALPDIDEDDSDSDGDDNFWAIMFKDGRFQTIEHPDDGPTHDEVFTKFCQAKETGAAFVLNKVVVDSKEVRSFGWGENLNVPEIEAFDGIVERMDALLDASENLFAAQQQLQAAQAQLFEEEVSAIQAENFKEQVRGTKPKGEKKKFRPPTS